VTHHTHHAVRRHHAVQHAKPKPKPTPSTHPTEAAPTENTVAAAAPVHVVRLAQHESPDGVSSVKMALASLALLLLALASLSLMRVSFFGMGRSRQSY
jgi:hypothetical protein